MKQTAFLQSMLQTYYDTSLLSSLRYHPLLHWDRFHSFVAFQHAFILKNTQKLHAREHDITSLCMPLF